uniref:Phosphoglycolate phosphatase n=1 Tax=Candidatus Kentrum sp. DK TaxID=2126562 RepID=A0A450S539_9GAMM|nr:MAG: phosphoglycolate phosphatase [Candidatus Kentron sp. DK]
MKNTRYTLLVFDWDGTLIDSETKIIAMFHAACDEIGVTRRQDADIRNIIGLGLPIAIQTLFPEQNARNRDRILTGYRHHFDATPASALFPGVPETLILLREQGFRMGIATGKSRRGLEKDLSDTGLREWFPVTRCADEAPSKPHPGMLYGIMEEIACAPKNTLMIGDTEHDLKMARNAGVDAVAAAYGVQGREHLLQWEPRAYLDAIPELIDWLMES